jgi:hypothetical protein
MTIADEIYNDPRIVDLTRGELTELLVECVDRLELDEVERFSNGAIVDALFIALAHLPIDDAAAARIRSAIEEYFEE